MKGFISKLFVALVFVGFISQPAFSNTFVNVSRANINPSIIQGIVLNLHLISEDNIRSVCTKNIEVTKPDDTSCQEAINNCVTIYENNCLLDQNNSFNCTEIRSTPENKTFKCDQDPAPSCDNFIAPNQSLFDNIKQTCAPASTTAALPPAGTNVTPPANTNTSDASPTGTMDNGNNQATGTTTGCSLSPFQSAAPMTGTGILSTLMMIPFALRLKKEKVKA